MIWILHIIEWLVNWIISRNPQNDQEEWINLAQVCDRLWSSWWSGAEFFLIAERCGKTDWIFQRLQVKSSLKNQETWWILSWNICVMDLCLLEDAMESYFQLVRVIEMWLQRRGGRSKLRQWNLWKVDINLRTSPRKYGKSQMHLGLVVYEVKNVWAQKLCSYFYSCFDYVKICMHIKM